MPLLPKTVMAAWFCLVCVSSLIGVSCIDRTLDPQLRCSKGYYSVCEMELPPTSEHAPQQPDPPCWVAVLVGGVIGRFYPEPTLKHVVRPLVKAGCAVDYYVMLSGPLDEGGFSAYWYRAVSNPRFGNMTWHAFEDYLLGRASRAGVRRAALYHHTDVALDSFPQNSSWRRHFRKGKKKSLTFIRNVLYLQGLEVMWNWTKSFKEHHLYTQVVVVRGDTYWLDDLPISMFDAHDTAYSRSLGVLCTEGVGKDDWPDDRVFVFGRDVADQILTAYTAFLHDQSPLLQGARFNEDFISRLAKLRGVRWRFVPRDLMPYFWAVHMQLPDREPFLCLRGTTRERLLNPRGRCIHPSRVQLPFCEDFPLL
mmetsp:Transcript_53687/g.156484  ORF Transcript_53687/g.156484 Transcript_53687/m.156484 type:complete len:365 (-) Transcript_53687:22-1116(-)